MEDEEPVPRRRWILIVAAAILATGLSDLLILLHVWYGLGWILACAAVACWLSLARRSALAGVIGAIAAAAHGGLYLWRTMTVYGGFWTAEGAPMVATYLWIVAAGLFVTLLVFEGLSRHAPK